MVGMLAKKLKRMRCPCRILRYKISTTMRGFWLRCGEANSRPELVLRRVNTFRILAKESKPRSHFQGHQSFRTDYENPSQRMFQIQQAFCEQSSQLATADNLFADVVSPSCNCSIDPSAEPCPPTQLDQPFQQYAYPKLTLESAHVSMLVQKRQMKSHFPLIFLLPDITVSSL